MSFVSVTGEMDFNPPMGGVADVALNGVAIAPHDEWITLIAIRVRRNPEHLRVIQAQNNITRLATATIQMQHEQFQQMLPPGSIPNIADLIDATQLEVAARFAPIIDQKPEAEVTVIGTAYITPMEAESPIIRDALLNLGLTSEEQTSAIDLVPSNLEAKVE